jgi:heavy metal sensor kinase
MTLRMRMTAWVATLLVAVLAGFGAFVYGSLRRGLEASIDDSLRMSAAQAVASLNIENGILDFRDAQPESETRAALQERGLTVRILDNAGGILHAFGPSRTLAVEDSSLTAARAGQEVFSTLADPRAGGSVRVLTVPIRDNGDVIGFVQVAQTLSGVQDSLRRLRSALLLGGPLLVLLAALGGFLLVGRTLAPIDFITRTARRISGEDLSARLNLRATNDEVGRLAATFDEMLARLEGAFLRERQFTADASHELRTPLAAMQVILNVVQEKQRSPQDYKRALSDIAEEVDRLRALAEDLLRLARGDSSQVAVTETVKLSEMLHDVSDSLQPLAEAKGLTLACTAADGLIVRGDGDGLIRLFVNILDNAVKFTERGGIEVAAHVDGAGVLVTVRDTGFGIPAEHLPHVFERFYRVERSRSGRGAGLGLSIAREIARAHGGTLELKSNPDAGTTAAVWLPR